MMRIRIFSLGYLKVTIRFKVIKFLEIKYFDINYILKTMRMKMRVQPFYKNYDYQPKALRLESRVAYCWCYISELKTI
jgi:hypothetical protein